MSHTDTGFGGFDTSKKRSHVGRELHRALFSRFLKHSLLCTRIPQPPSLFYQQTSIFISGTVMLVTVGLGVASCTMEKRVSEFVGIMVGKLVGALVVWELLQMFTRNTVPQTVMIPACLWLSEHAVESPPLHRAFFLCIVRRGSSFVASCIPYLAWDDTRRVQYHLRRVTATSTNFVRASAWSVVLVTHLRCHSSTPLCGFQGGSQLAQLKKQDNVILSRIHAPNVSRRHRTTHETRGQGHRSQE